MASFLHVEPPEGAPFRVELHKDKHTIGRSKDNDIVLPDLSLSRYHAEITREGSRFYVADCKSRNKTWLNNVQLAGRKMLKDGDIVRLGTTRLTFQTAGVPSTTVVLDDKSRQGDAPQQTIAGTLTVKDLFPKDSYDSQTTDSRTLLRELEYLSVFNKVTLELVAHRPPEELFEVVLDLLLDAVNAERGILLLLEGEPPQLQVKLTRTREGEETEDAEITVSRSVLDRVVSTRTATLTRSLQQEFQTVIGFEERSVMCAPLWDNKEVIGVIYVDSRSQHKVFFRDDLRLLTVLANMIAVKIENAKLIEEALEKRRLERELSLAAEIQERLLPARPPEVPGYQVVSYQMPCFTVGGDYYDFMLTPGALTTTIGDVAGKGVGAALLMSHVQAVLRTLVEQGAAPMTAIDRLNRSVCRHSTAGKFVTFFFCRLVQETGEVEYINAGHNDPILIRASGALVPLTVGGMVLGVDPDAEHPSGKAKLEPGDTLFLFTDGVTDVKDMEGGRFGDERVHKILRTTAGRSVALVKEALLEAHEVFSGGAPPADDVTFVMIRRLRQSEIIARRRET